MLLSVHVDTLQILHGVIVREELTHRNVVIFLHVTQYELNLML